MEGRNNQSTIRLGLKRARNWLRGCAFAAASCPLFAFIAGAHQLLLSDTAADPTPAIPPRLVWPGVAVIIVLAIFVTAALAGPIIRANTDEPPANPPPENPE